MLLGSGQEGYWRHLSRRVYIEVGPCRRLPSGSMKGPQPGPAVAAWTPDRIGALQEARLQESQLCSSRGQDPATWMSDQIGALQRA